MGLRVEPSGRTDAGMWRSPVEVEAMPALLVEDGDEEVVVVVVGGGGVTIEGMV